MDKVLSESGCAKKLTKTLFIFCCRLKIHFQITPEQQGGFCVCL